MKEKDLDRFARQARDGPADTEICNLNISVTAESREIAENEKVTMKKAVALAVLACAFALPAAAQDTCKRNRESGFSYCPPANWAISSSLDDKFKTFMGPSDSILTPNLNVTSADDDRPLRDLVAAIIQSILADPKGAGATAVKVLSQSDFVTASGARGVRVVFRLESGPIVRRAIQYFFNGKSIEKLMVTGTALESARETYDAVFDRAMKTFQIEP